MTELKECQMLQRICGKCGCLLNKENTGELGWLQPDCNDCTENNKQLPEDK